MIGRAKLSLNKLEKAVPSQSFFAAKIPVAIPVFVMLVGFALLAGCGSGSGIGSIIGIDKGRTPDEFAVVRRAPLTLPPNFELRPPDPNGQRSQDVAARDSAKQTVFGDAGTGNGNGGTTIGKSDKGDELILAKTGATNANANIRQQLDQENSALVTVDQGFLNDLMFWKKNKGQATNVVDASAEAKRLQENNALGQAITEGQTPTIRRTSDKAFFDWF